MKKLIMVLTLFTYGAHAAPSFDEAVQKLKAKYALIDQKKALRAKQKQEKKSLRDAQVKQRESLQDKQEHERNGLTQ